MPISNNVTEIGRCNIIFKEGVQGVATDGLSVGVRYLYSFKLQVCKLLVRS
jgi:hypothetical protein